MTNTTPPAPDLESIIAAALAGHDTWVPDTEHGAVVCDECGWEIYSKWVDPNAEQTTEQRKYAHQARAVLAALRGAGTVQFGATGEGRVREYGRDRRSAQLSARRRRGALVSRMVTPWTAVEV